MTASLARYLPDFEFSGIRSFQASQQAADLSEPARPELELDVEAIRAEGREEGEAAARAELLQQHERELQAMEERHAAELIALRAELEAAAAQSVPDAVNVRNAEIADLIASDVEAVLAPLIDEAMRSSMLTALAGEIRAALALDNAGQVSVSGPEGLVSALMGIIGVDADRLAISHSEAIEIQVEVDRTRFASRLTEWSRTLAEGLA